MLNGPMAMPLVLPEEGGRDVRAVLLDLQLRVDAGLLELAESELERVHRVAAVAGRDAELRLQTLREAGLGEQAAGLLRVVPIVLGTGPELIDARRPLGRAA